MTCSMSLYFLVTSGDLGLVMKELVYTSVTQNIGSYKVRLESLCVYFFLVCYVHGKLHIVGCKDFEEEYKSIHGKNLDIGLFNHLNPRQNSKCTIFMTGFFPKVLFCMLGKC